MEDEDIQESGPVVSDGAPADPDAWPGALPKQAAFLTALVICAGHKTLAAKAARISRRLHYTWLETDPNYQKLYALAEKMAGEVLEDEARRRAFEGVREAIFWQGVKVGTKLVYSDSLMQFMLRGQFPEKYRERFSARGTATTPEGASIEIEFVTPLAE